ncbi:MAG: YraN family protein [Oleibacter sp.]|nr:YraN family protein [Thalassolituus sp.]
MNLFGARHTRARGNAIEREAEKFLRRQGLTLVECNYTVKMGEIDLIMRDQNTLIFIEVRYRNNSNYGSGAASVTAKKQRRLKLAAQHYLALKFGAAEPDCRFDVMSGCGEPVVFEWIKNAF